jgi:4a-hydroxytetrahydrobiopterin dehydratase
MPLSAEQITARLREMPGWSFKDNALVRQMTCASFPDAVAFVTRLAFEAEAEDHHPDILVSYKRVTVSWSTHDEGGVTEKDFAGARTTNEIAARFVKGA